MYSTLSIAAIISCSWLPFFLVPVTAGYIHKGYAVSNFLAGPLWAVTGLLEGALMLLVPEDLRDHYSRKMYCTSISEEIVEHATFTDKKPHYFPTVRLQCQWLLIIHKINMNYNFPMWQQLCYWTDTDRQKSKLAFIILRRRRRKRRTGGGGGGGGGRVGQRKRGKKENKEQERSEVKFCQKKEMSLFWYFLLTVIYKT